MAQIEQLIGSIDKLLQEVESIKDALSSLKEEVNAMKTSAKVEKPTVEEIQTAELPVQLTFEVNGVSFTMVKVEGGTFMMGATPEQSEDAADNERPVHQVSLDDYYIGQTQVTQALWQAVMGENPSKFKGENNPVEYVSWNGCQKFVKKLSKLTGCRFRLPTEAQWEYAARGGNKSKGYKYAGSNDLDAVAWYDDNSSGQTHPVAQKAPNELGLYDMSGNVEEWCADWFGGYSEQRQHNPTGPASGSKRVRRGGSWDCSARRCRVSYRCYSILLACNGNRRGLRLVLVPGYRQILDGHEYVDLGLPSGTLWATCNVGANSPEEYGDYFAWGETMPKSDYRWSNYQYGSSSRKLTKYCNNSDYGKNGFTDNKTTLDAGDDAATANWGREWRMPTLEEIQELLNNTTTTWATQNGVSGRKFTASNGNSIFLPAAGYYSESDLFGAGSHGIFWSGSLETGRPGYAHFLRFNSGCVGWTDNYRCLGRSVRPVVKELTITPAQQSVGAAGGSFEVTVTSNTSWSVTINQPWVTLSANSGSGDASFSVLVAANETATSDNATITVTTATGNVTKTVAITRGGQPGTLQGHDYVDLGLPSGTLWATCNVGANTPEEYGDYFAWGETTPKTSTYQYGLYSKLTKYCNNSDYGKNGFTDTKNTLDAGDDAATANWGSGWRMPTRAEIKELYKYCSSTRTTQNGVSGRRFTASNGNSIFLPAAGCNGASGLKDAGSYGCYWSGSLYTRYPNDAYDLFFTSDFVYGGSSLNRFCGLSVRPVVKQNSSPFVAELSITPVQQSVGAAGGSFEVTVISNTSWSVTTNQPWVTLSANSGSGNGSFSVLVAANESFTSDNATITVTTASGNVTQTVAITRAGQTQGNGSLRGHDYVDLGLPSGTLWATCNVGANSPEEYGDYFAWGETTPKTNYSWKTYKYGIDKDQLTKYCNNSDCGKNGFTDTKTTLDAEDDAATANWGSGWRMPTKAEIQELKDNTTTTWTTQNGVSGHRFTGPNGNSIFLPAAGYYYKSGLLSAGSVGGYWSGSLNTHYPYGAYYLHFPSDRVGWYYCGRVYGRSVRPVVKR